MTQWGLDTLFNPAKRHMDEEKRRLQSTREEVGDNSGGKRIDLESGKVVIGKAEDDESSVETKTAGKAHSAGAKSESAKDLDDKDLTDAQRRARERRRRAAK